MAPSTLYLTKLMGAGSLITDWLRYRREMRLTERLPLSALRASLLGASLFIDGVVA